METLAVQMVWVAVLLAVCFTGPALALFFLLRRKRLARRRRRSPIGIALLRGPGHSLREQLDEAGSDFIVDLMQLIVVPLAILAVFLAQSLTDGLSKMISLLPLYVLSAVGVFVYVIRKLLKAGEALDNLKAGYDAEVAVGQELNQLMRQGAATFNDLPADNFNIDHVVVSAEGVFAVETKGFTKPKQGRGKADATVEFDGQVLTFPTWSAKGPLEQAERQAAWLARWLTSATGLSVHVRPVLALPGWYVERTGRGNVWVFSGKELAGLLKSRGTPSLSAQDVQHISHQVEQRCRTVAPLYAGGEKAP
jgi:Nuclease-related domain